MLGVFRWSVMKHKHLEDFLFLTRLQTVSDFREAFHMQHHINVVIKRHVLHSNDIIRHCDPTLKVQEAFVRWSRAKEPCLTDMVTLKAVGVKPDVIAFLMRE